MGALALCLQPNSTVHKSIEALWQSILGRRGWEGGKDLTPLWEPLPAAISARRVWPAEGIVAPKETLVYSNSCDENYGNFLRVTGLLWGIISNVSERFSRG